MINLLINVPKFHLNWYTGMNKNLLNMKLCKGKCSNITQQLCIEFITLKYK